MIKNNFRIEKDSMGEIEVPKNAYYGAGSARAFENFKISGFTMPICFIYALATVKKSAAITNCQLGLLDEKLKNVIVQASDEVLTGKFDNQFIVDVFQTGSGTSTNMNMNEVIANRANEILGHELGTYKVIHPNDHVNMGQSSNDTIPTALNMSALLEIEHKLIPVIVLFIKELEKKENEFKSIIKIGRTHLQDAVPMTLGQEFSAFKTSAKEWILMLENSKTYLKTLALGGTAVGTGINTHKDFANKTIELISQFSNVTFSKTTNHFKSSSQISEIVNLSGILKTMATSLMKIANDIRFLSSGPRCGLGELTLPETQPGSSIMPGKVNPVIAESVCQVAAQIIGNDSTITISGQYGSFQLNTMFPVVAYNIIQSIQLLTNAIGNFTNKCVIGIKANKEVCDSNIEKSLALATPLAKVIGYDKASKIAKKAYKEGKTVREVAEEENILNKKQLNDLLDPKNMI